MLDTERSALEERVASAEAKAAANNAQAELSAFREITARSEAVMNRRLGTLSGWINGDNPNFVNFYQQVEILGRAPNGSGWDDQRGAAEATINPIFYRDLNVAALTLDGEGTTYYGEYSVLLRSVTIEGRSSVFEENPFIFNGRHHVVSGRQPPAGYRAPWNARESLCVAKLGARLTSGMTDADFARLVLGPDRTSDTCDFVEVHIYGPINRMAIARVSGPEPTEQPDRLLWRQVTRRLKELGADVETTN
jgi:hypothetical protein